MIPSGNGYVYHPIRPLVEEWRHDAGILRKYGCEVVAHVLDTVAYQAQVSVVEGSEEKLTLKQASELSGYSMDHLSRLVRDGMIPNAGEHGAPRIKHVDLPRKPVGKSTPQSHVDSEQIVQSIINRGD